MRTLPTRHLRISPLGVTAVLVPEVGATVLLWIEPQMLTPYIALCASAFVGTGLVALVARTVRTDSRRNAIFASHAAAGHPAPRSAPPALSERPADPDAIAPELCESCAVVPGVRIVIMRGELLWLCGPCSPSPQPMPARVMS